jgi:tripartite-type tricarboxylate transporter receptor subunit TctC
MKINRHHVLRLATIIGAMLAVPLVAAAQNFPTRPVTMIVPYVAGGPTDLIARLISGKMQEQLGQPIVVANLSGAGGSIGVSKVARAVPDGYTLSIGNNGSNILGGALYPSAFDLLKDFEPIAKLASNPQVIISRKTIPSETLTELITWLKENQKKVSVGIAGPVAIVSVVNFENMTSTQLQIVPYRGAAPAIQDLMAGQIDLMIDQLSNAVPQIRAATIRAYAVTANRRSPAAPQIPTVDEAGLPGFYASLWSGLWAPKGTPHEVVLKINAAVRLALADPVVKQRLADIGQDIVPTEEQNPEALAAYQKAEIEKWWPIAKAANLKSE